MKISYPALQEQNQYLAQATVQVDPLLNSIIVDKEDADQAYMKIGHNFSGYEFVEDTEFMLGNRIFGQGGFPAA